MIPKAVNDKMNLDPFYEKCCFREYGSCGGRITREHSLIYAGKQVQELESIIPLCEKHHGVLNYQDVTSIDKERSHWIALNRMKNKFYMYPKSDWVQRLKYLNTKYGEYNIKG